MKFTNKKAILFDLDGTLIDSAPDLVAAVNYMLVKLDRAAFSEEIVRAWIGNGAATLVNRALSGKSEISQDLDTDLAEQALKIFVDFYKDNICVKTVLYPSVRACLKILKARGFQLVLVTNKPFDLIAPILTGLELDGLFTMQLGGESLAKRKPDPMPLLHVCQELNLTVDQCVMVGDSKNDILAAKAAKMESIGLTYGYNYGEDIGLHGPEVVYDDFSDIVAAFSPDYLQ